MAAAFFRSAHRASRPYVQRRASRLTEVVIQRNSRQQKVGSRSTAAHSSYVLQMH